MNQCRDRTETHGVKVFLCRDRDEWLGTYPDHYAAYCALCQATEKGAPAYVRIDDRHGVNQCMRTGDAIEYLARPR